MGIYKDWLSIAYDARGGLVKKTWDAHLPLEQAIYENMLSSKNNVISGKFSDLAESYNMSLEQMAGFLDGISGALDVPPDIEEIEADSQIDVKVDFETLYKKMVEYKASHLLNLPEWENVFDAQKRDQLYREQKASGTVIVGEKTGRNDPCPCESGKKFKKCCG
ncbi:MAG: SEC-C metal-binding domain-containing protein [Defluviitaleaceae bacterium]|nr:SEC-C metal-binding domain-containing protein [Defluviitaleaceae bacterium]